MQITFKKVRTWNIWNTFIGKLCQTWKLVMIPSFSISSAAPGFLWIKTSKTDLPSKHRKLIHLLNVKNGFTIKSLTLICLQNIENWFTINTLKTDLPSCSQNLFLDSPIQLPRLFFLSFFFFFFCGSTSLLLGRICLN